MTVTNEVSKFLDQLKKSGFSKLVSLMNNDIALCKTQTVDSILAGNLRLPFNWSEYQLVDVDVIYTEDMLNFADKLEMYGIRRVYPAIFGTDIATIILYQFDVKDAFGGVISSATLYRAMTKGNDDSFSSKLVMLYD